MKATIFIDRGYLRILVKQAGSAYTPKYIEQIAHTCLKWDEESLLRVLSPDLRSIASGTRAKRVTWDLAVILSSMAQLRVLTTITNGGSLSMRCRTVAMRATVLIPTRMQPAR